MGFSVFGFILLIILCVLFFVKNGRKRFMVSLGLLIFVTTNICMGYFFASGEKYIGFQIVLMFYATFTGLLALKEKKEKDYWNLKLEKAIIWFVGALLISTVLFYIYRYDSPVIADSDYENFILGKSGYGKLGGSDIKLGWIYVAFLYCALLWLIQRILTIDNLVTVIKGVIKYSYVVVVVGYCEFLLENLFSSTLITDVTVALIGEVPGQQMDLSDRNGLSAIQSTTKEASMFSTVLLYNILMALGAYGGFAKMPKGTKIYIYLSMLLLAINMSMSSFFYLLLVCFIIVYGNYCDVTILSNRKFRRVLIMITLAVLLLSVGSIELLDSDNYFWGRIGIALSQMSDISDVSDFGNNSEGIRFLGIYHCISIFIDRPLFGIGIGTITAVSGIASFLANIGGVSTYLWMCLQACFSKKNLRHIIVLVFLVAILPNLFLNDLYTMFCLCIPISVLLLSLNLQFSK